MPRYSLLQSGMGKILDLTKQLRIANQSTDRECGGQEGEEEETQIREHALNLRRYPPVVSTRE